MRYCLNLFTGLILGIMMLAGCQPVTSSDSNKVVYQRVITTGKIRCGWFDWEPLLKKDINSKKFSGIAVDLMDEIATRLNITYEWAEEIGPSTAVQSIQSKRVDMICIPVIITNPRMRVADFSDPILYSRFSVWMREDSPLTDTSALNGPDYKFVAIDGTAPMAMTKRLFPRAQMLSLTELSPSSDMFSSVIGKKADAVFSDSSNAGLYARHNPGEIKPLLDGDTDRILPWSFMMPAGEYEFTNMIDLVLRDMQLDGTVARIVRKHKAEEMYFPPALRYDKRGFIRSD